MERRTRGGVAVGILPYPYRGEARERDDNKLADLELNIWASGSSPGPTGQEYTYRALIRFHQPTIVGKRNRLLHVLDGPHAGQYRIVQAKVHPILDFTEAELRVVRADG